MTSFQVTTFVPLKKLSRICNLSQQKGKNVDKELIAPFDTGEYYVGKYDLSDAIYGFAYLLNESLREKSLAPVGRKFANIGGVQTLIRNISSYLGFCNLALASFEDKPFSLAHLIDERPSGFLEPLTDAEWQMLSEKAV